MSVHNVPTPLDGAPTPTLEAEVPSSDLLQQLTKSMHSAIASAMSAVNANISRSVSLALATPRQEETTVISVPPSVPHASAQVPSLLRPGKSSRKRRHCLDILTRPVALSTEGDGDSHSKTSVPPEEKHVAVIRPPAHGDYINSRASHVSKRVKPNSFVELSEDDSDMTSDHQGTDWSEDDESLEEEAGPSSAPAPQAEPSGTPVDSLGVPFFNPDDITHPRSGEWTPSPQVSKYIETWLRRSLDRANRSKLRAECPRPSIGNSVAKTPDLDPILVRYLLKSGKNPKKGIDKSFKGVQDKLLDILGPLTKILDMSEQAVASDAPVNAEILRGWALRAICLLGNANTAMSAERRRSILMRLDPQLTHLASDEPGPSAEGLLFGESFIKNINKFVGLFSSLDKAQSSLKKSSQGKVFNKAGRGRGRPSSRGSYYRPYHRGTVHFTPDRQHYTPAPPMQPATPFFPTRGRPWRTRGSTRGFPRTRGTGY
ncbi:uncharacterized protein LOC130367476 [Hyla sarda]|uniref:uncharacterized protein LOC130367476 n=1 Tax=Hyla sarda TaxID=327740 RepID=UPI0024C3CCD5|nr:uncharacterized protein LOC130367476 [Hyla sarda]